MSTDDPSRQKRCYKCKKWQAVSEFNKNASASDGLNGRCRTCNRAWYEANREKHIKNVRKNSDARIREVQGRIHDYLLAHPCVDCGEIDPCVLDFDHVRGKKVAAVTRMIRNYGWAKIAEEIEKCDVRCANCHRRITAWRAETFRSKAHNCAQLSPLVLQLTRLVGIYERPLGRQNVGDPRTAVRGSSV